MADPADTPAVSVLWLDGGSQDFYTVTQASHDGTILTLAGGKSNRQIPLAGVRWYTLTPDIAEPVTSADARTGDARAMLGVLASQLGNTAAADELAGKPGYERRPLAELVIAIAGQAVEKLAAPVWVAVVDWPGPASDALCWVYAPDRAPGRTVLLAHYDGAWRAAGTTVLSGITHWTPAVMPTPPGPRQ
jgi:hypothetical protein